MSYAKTTSKLESLIEDVPQVNYTICEATINHCDQIFNLVQEYYTEYGIPKNRQLNISTFRRDGFETSSPCFRCFIALTKTRGGIDEIIGFVLWYRSFGSTTGPRVYLEALFVTKLYRQKQVEQALFEETLQ
ncbi:uncharacterized protein LOC126904207 isoform X2 [Daktulosphaira vitifoliae]|nr:uncharacterized protein LOC126904207 isoform X2 [Daktulosphaira vitifoliae]